MRSAVTELADLPGVTRVEVRAGGDFLSALGQQLPELFAAPLPSTGEHVMVRLDPSPLPEVVTVRAYAPGWPFRLVALVPEGFSDAQHEVYVALRRDGTSREQALGLAAELG